MNNHIFKRLKSTQTRKKVSYLNTQTSEPILGSAWLIHRYDTIKFFVVVNSRFTITNRCDIQLDRGVHHLANQSAPKYGFSRSNSDAGRRHFGR